MNKIKYYQSYLLHMKNGDKLEYLDDLPIERGIIGKLMRHSREIIVFGNDVTYYIPIENIEYISACGAKKVV